MIAAILATKTGRTVAMIGAGVVLVLLIIGGIYAKGAYDQSERDAAAKRKATVEAYQQRQGLNEQAAAMGKPELCGKLGGTWNKDAATCE